MTPDPLRRVLARLGEGDLPGARADLDVLAGEDGAGVAHDPLLHRLWLFLVVGRRGPGHVTAALADAPPVPPGPGAAEVAVMDASLRASEALGRGDAAALLHDAVAAADQLPDGATPFTGLVVAATLQAAYRFTGDAGTARRAVEVCARVGDRTDAPAIAVQARALAGNVRMLQGRLHEADELFGGALELAARTGRPDSPECAMARQFRGYVLFEWNRLDDARAELLEAVRLGEAAGSRGVLSGAYRVLSALELTAGRAGAAESWMGRLEALMDEGPLSERNREWLAATRAGLSVATGDLRAADAWIRRRGYRARELAAADAGALLAALHEVTVLLDVLLALDRLEEARLLAAAARVAAASRDRAWFAARADAVEAAALDGLGKAGEADEAATRGLERGRDEGFVRAYAEVGAPLLPVLERLAARNHASGHLGRVLAATREVAVRRGPRPSLTEREREVLGLLARGLANREIAERLGVSLPTVKTHLRHLYAKLDVGSRTRAVSRAEALALL